MLGMVLNTKPYPRVTPQAEEERDHDKKPRKKQRFQSEIFEHSERQLGEVMWWGLGRRTVSCTEVLSPRHLRGRL